MMKFTHTPPDPLIAALADVLQYLDARRRQNDTPTTATVYEAEAVEGVDQRPTPMEQISNAIIEHNHQ